VHERGRRDERIGEMGSVALLVGLGAEETGRAGNRLFGGKDALGEGRLH
jgi:hypothetical protein